LKTEKSLRSGRSNPTTTKTIDQLSDDELLRKNGATRRAVASSVLGIAINIGLAVACPPFAAGAAINAWQIGVSATNRHRVKREVNKRRQDNIVFEKRYNARNKPVRDVLIACTIKGAFTAATMGIVGFDHIADGFDDLMHHTAAAATHFAANGVGDSAAYATPTGSHQLGSIQNQVIDDNSTSDHEAILKRKHPTLYKMDKGFHKISGIGDAIADALGLTKGGKITSEVSWARLGDVIEHGVSKAEAFFKTATIGAANEILQPAAQVATQIAEKFVDRWDARRYMSIAGSDTIPLLSEQEHISHARKLTSVRDELRQRLRIRRVSGTSSD